MLQWKEARHPAITFDRYELLTDQFKLSSQYYLRKGSILEVLMLTPDNF